MRVGDFEISIFGALPFDERAVTGITITYGYNMIPYARLQLDAPWLQQYYTDFLCNPDDYKKRSEGTTTIIINSPKGCLYFEGYFDGLSLMQTPGGFEYSAIIKSKFQRLLEIYPRMIGMVPGSMNLGTYPETLKMIHGKEDHVWAQLKIGTETIDCTISVSDFIKQTMIKLVKSQAIWKVNTNLNTDMQPLYLYLKNTVHKENIDQALPLLESLDTSALSNCVLKASLCAGGILDLIMGSQEHLWGLMVKTYDALGCALVVGTNSIYVVPNAAFMKIGNSFPEHKQESDTINHAYPADYNNFIFSDNGFVNIKCCYIVPQSQHLPGSTIQPIKAVCSNLGMYPPLGVDDPEVPDDGSSGILALPTDSFIISGLANAFTANAEMQKKLSDGVTNCDLIVTDTNKPYQDMIMHSDDQKKSYYKYCKQVFNQYAKLKFMQAKYQERGGSFTTIFNPKWVPATTGSLYSRNPGLYFNFYVTSVTHSIQLRAPNIGVATTQVNFNSARFNGNPDKVPGIHMDDFYMYSQDDMVAFQQKWVSDITGK